MKHVLIAMLIVGTLFSCVINAQTTRNNMEKKKNYSVEIIRYNISADQHQNFEQAYTSAGKYLQSSPYCLGYQLIHGKEEPDNYIVIIHWTSVDDHLNGFRKSADFMPFFNLVKPFFNNIKEMKHYEMTEIEWQK